MTERRGFDPLDEDAPSTTVIAAVDPAGHDVWTETAATPEFAALRRRLIRFVGPATALFLAWFGVYLLLNGHFREFLGMQVGGIPVVLLLAVGQFFSTFALTAAYNRYAERRLDPLAARLRSRLEDGSC